MMTEKMPEPAGCGPVMHKLKQLLIVKTGTTYPAVREKAGDFDDMIIDKMGLKREDVAVCSIYQGDALLKPEGFRCVIITGSHDMVTDRSPWMVDLMDWVRDKAYGRIPMLGICFGHQLMAMALGGTADFHPRGVELGTVEVELTAEGRTDPLMAGLPARFYAHATHAQTVSVTPPGTRALAYNSHEQHHALAFGGKAWGVQFHPEYSADVVRGYIEQARHGLESRGYNVDGMLDAVQESPWGGMILKRFLELAAT